MSDQARVTLGPVNLSEGEMKGYAVGKRNLLIARHGGKVRALDDWCNHAGCLLSGGRVEGSMVVCSCHEVGFDLATGKNVTSPGVCDDQRTFRVEEEDGEVVVYGFPDSPLP
ncbi:MAG: Rieske (2Fe-2S) protein [Myxococcales bacterium]|nr:Rieske (2Fe-2S) protein [Myxococcales bacterium]